jgi:thiamine biosynthesis lipoprotein
MNDDMIDMQKIEFQAMGCHMMAMVDSASSDAIAILKSLPAQFEAWEQCLSRFRNDSELSRLNRSHGQWTPVSSTLWTVLMHTLWGARESNGIVTPTLLAPLESAGYDRSFNAMKADAQPKHLLTTKHSWRDIEMDANGCAVRLPFGMKVDLGGVAKGWAAQEAARTLGAFGAALVDAGGDIAVRGGPLPIGISNPFVPEEPLAVVAVANAAVATSGRDYRRWQMNGTWQHHIIDPRTLAPAQTDVLTASAIAPDAVSAEVAAKAMLILGSEAGMNWIEWRGWPALLVLEDGTVVRSSRFAQHESQEEMTR